MAKKPNQWSLDRAYYFIPSNENKFRTTLKIISDIESGKKSQEEGLKKAVELGLISSAERYLTSTQTLFNSYGLIYEPFKLTEVGNAFVKNKISYKDLGLIQLLKKEFKYDDNADVVRPFFVTLNILLKLYGKNKDQCWIDCYDYQKYLTEIKKNSEIDEYVKLIINDRNSDRILPYDEYKDFEVWMYAFRTSGLINDYGDNQSINVDKQKYTINFDEIDLIHELVDNENKFEVLGEYSHRQSNRSEVLKEFGKLENGFYNILPNINVGQGFEISNIHFDETKFVQDYFFTKLSHQNIDHSLVVAENIYDSRGLLSTLLMRSLGFSNADYKSILHPYRNRKDLLKLSSKYRKLGKIYELLFEKKGELSMLNLFDELRSKGGENRIYYGAPGCGKSRKIKDMLEDSNVDEDNIIRTVFHPEYANCDFVGQIMPYVEKDKVTYEFNPGPFTKALIKAYETNDLVFLVIEEMNRGNAAAIFGDLFQLLDREKKFDKKGNLNPKYGASEYPISNPTLEKYIRDTLGKDGYELADDFKIILPTNLTILATMNSSDQNVFTLDTAFKRRWYFEQIDNSILSDEDCYYRKYYVPNTSVTWEMFMNKVNDEILESKFHNQTNEDKRMGKYFISQDCLVKNEKEYDKTASQNFAYKVLEYLWNDVCKIGRENWFKEKTLEKLINDFMFNEDPLSVFINIDNWK